MAVVNNRNPGLAARDKDPGLARDRHRDRDRDRWDTEATSSVGTMEAEAAAVGGDGSF